MWSGGLELEWELEYDRESDSWGMECGSWLAEVIVALELLLVRPNAISSPIVEGLFMYTMSMSSRSALSSVTTQHPASSAGATKFSSVRRWSRLGITYSGEPDCWPSSSGECGIVAVEPRDLSPGNWLLLCRESRLVVLPCLENPSAGECAVIRQGSSTFRSKMSELFESLSVGEGGHVEYAVDLVLLRDKELFKTSWLILLCINTHTVHSLMSSLVFSCFHFFSRMVVYWMTEPAVICSICTRVRLSLFLSLSLFLLLLY